MQIKHSTDGLSIPHVSSTKKIFIANNDKSHRVCVCVCVASVRFFQTAIVDHPME